MKKALLVLAIACSAVAQTSQRQVILTWEDLLNPAGTTYSVYRANGQCATATAFTRLASAITPKTYTDTANPGQYCYHVTAVLNAVESDPSNTAEAKVKPASPQKLNLTVN
jgi:fibronectin type 3 domain-containing protein